MSQEVPTRKQRQAETRRRLLAAAARAFAAKGFHGASVSGITADAGVTTGALYANFAGKEALFLALLDEHIAAQRAEAQRAAEEDPAALPERVTDRMRQLIAELTRPGRLTDPPAADGRLSPAQAQALTLEGLLYAVRERPELRQALAERYRAIDTAVAELITIWLDATGHTAALPAADLAAAHSWLVEGLGLRLALDPEHMAPSRAARLLTALIVDLPVTADPLALPEATP